jgi:hypothetical protein
MGIAGNTYDTWHAVKIKIPGFPVRRKRRTYGYQIKQNQSNKNIDIRFATGEFYWSQMTVPREHRPAEIFLEHWVSYVPK